MRLLVVHGDAGLRRQIAAELTARGHTADSAPRIDAQVEQAAIVIVDHRLLPCLTQAQVLAVVPEADEADVLAAFAAGADDVLAGPLRPSELASRVARLARGVGPGPIRVGPITIDSASRLVLLAGHPVELTRREYDLLRLLAAAPGRVFTKQDLLREIWGAPLGSSTRRLDTQVKYLAVWDCNSQGIGPGGTADHLTRWLKAGLKPDVVPITRILNDAATEAKFPRNAMSPGFRSMPTPAASNGPRPV